MADHHHTDNPFAKWFLPGLIVGLIVGLAVGAFVVPLLDRSTSIPATVTGGARERGPRVEPIPGPTINRVDSPVTTPAPTGGAAPTPAPTGAAPDPKKPAETSPAPVAPAPVAPAPAMPAPADPAPKAPAPK
jgi:uncharacterized RDD family membrane protein YckC